MNPKSAKNQPKVNLNNYMHPRNIYRNKPNYGQMAKDFPSFGSFVKSDATGRIVIDFNDSNALRTLTQTLLKKDFDLDVVIPHNRLIPTVPQRLNYVLWMQDLVDMMLDVMPSRDDHLITGIDVGTGSSCIFPLLSCAINKTWNFIATDVDSLNIQFATNNVANNNLSHRIKVVEVNDGTIIKSIIKNNENKIDFIMCNPPFFNHHMDEFDDETNTDCNPHRRKSPSNTSLPSEAVTDGGEVAFVTRLIEESLETNDEVTIYTTMLGKKKSLHELKSKLKLLQQSGLISSYTNTEFCQGKTKRWGLAWTMTTSINLKDAPTIKCEKQKPPLVYFLPPTMNECHYNLCSVKERIIFLLQDLKIDFFELIRESKHSVEFVIKANTNTWSNQRRKRREAKLKQHLNSINSVPQAEDQLDVSDTKIESFSSTDERNSIEHMETDRIEVNSSNFNSKKRKNENSCSEDSFDDDCKKSKDAIGYHAPVCYLLDCSLKIKKIRKSLLIEMQSKECAQNKECTYQLFQYFKNKLI